MLDRWARRIAIAAFFFNFSEFGFYNTLFVILRPGD
jgi:hypothetical protein